MTLSPQQFKSWGEYLKATNTKLYHGTNVEFSPKTRKVRPFTNSSDESGYGSGMKVAHATTDLDEARQYGQHVYEVDPDEHTHEGFGPTAVYSEKGFKIIKKVQ